MADVREDSEVIVDRMKTNQSEVAVLEADAALIQSKFESDLSYLEGEITKLRSARDNRIGERELKIAELKKRIRSDYQKLGTIFAMESMPECGKPATHHTSDLASPLTDLDDLERGISPSSNDQQYGNPRKSLRLRIKKESTPQARQTSSSSSLPACVVRRPNGIYVELGCPKCQSNARLKNGHAEFFCGLNGLRSHFALVHPDSKAYIEEFEIREIPMNEIKALEKGANIIPHRVYYREEWVARAESTAVPSIDTTPTIPPPNIGLRAHTAKCEFRASKTPRPEDNRPQILSLTSSDDDSEYNG